MTKTTNKRSEKMIKNIADIRKAKNMQQKELAEKAGVDLYWINKIENGKGTPSLAVLEKIANALGVSVKEFF